MPPINVLIVDDDPNCREALRAALGDTPDIAIAGVSPSGKVGLARALQMQPDLVIAPAVMADTVAAEFTRHILSAIPHAGVLITARNEPRYADMTIDALEAGAFDFVLKPEGPYREEGIAALRRMLLPKIRGFSIKRYSRIVKSFARESAAPPGAQDGPCQERAKAETALRTKVLGARQESGRVEAILIGASTGGPEALSELIPALPGAFPAPIVIVLHMPKLFTGRMAQALDRDSALAVKEAEDGDVLRAGHVYLAPGGQQLVLERGTQRRLVLRTTDGPPENGCKPSVDVLFRSAALVLKRRALAVILTGMGEDGTKGLIELKKRNVSVLAQDEASAIVWGMPGSAVRAKCVDEVLPLGEMARRIAEIATESAE